MMHRYPKGSHTLPQQDAVPGWARIVLYLVAIVAPFGALALGQLDGPSAVAAVVTLFGVIGPAVAVVYQRKQEGDQGAHFRQGYAAAVQEHVVPLVVDSPQAGPAAGGPSTSGNTPGALEGPHNEGITR